MSDDDTYSYWETGREPRNPTVMTAEQIKAEFDEYGGIAPNQFTIKHWKSGAEWDAPDFLEQLSYVEEDDDEDYAGSYRLWEKGYASDPSYYNDLDDVLATLKMMTTSEADSENRIYPGRFVVQNWDTKQRWDAVDFLAAHGFTVPEDYDPPGTVYRVYPDKKNAYDYWPMNDLGEIVEEYYGQGCDIGLRRKVFVLNKATGESTDIMDILAEFDFTTCELPKYEVWQTRYSDQREVPMEIEAKTLEDAIDELVDIELAQGASATEPGVRSIFDYSTGKESDVAAFLKKHRKLAKEIRAQKAS